MKIRPVVPYGQTERQTYAQTDVMELITTFRNFANDPKKGQISLPSLNLVWLSQPLFPRNSLYLSALTGDLQGIYKKKKMLNTASR